MTDTIPLITSVIHGSIDVTLWKLIFLRSLILNFEITSEMVGVNCCLWSDLYQTGKMSILRLLIRKCNRTPTSIKSKKPQDKRPTKRPHKT